MPEMLLVLQRIEYAKGVVLPILRELQRQIGGPVRSGLIADFLDLKCRQTYNYLRALEIAGFARLEGKRWKAV